MTFTDASRTFEVEVRHGAPVSATMTDVRGETTLGEAAFDALLSIGMARFDVQDVPDFEIVNVELGGSLEEITRERLARVRAAQRVLTGRSLIHVQKVEFVDDRNAVLTPSMPQQDRSLLEAFLRGESPRACIMSGLASALRVEAVLNDAARRGVVVAIHASSGDEVLGAAIDAQPVCSRGQESRMVFSTTMRSLSLWPVIRPTTCNQQHRSSPTMASSPRRMHASP